MYIRKIYGSRFMESRKSRNEHMTTRNSRVFICRCFKATKVGNYLIWPRFTKRVPYRRSKYDIKIRVLK